MARGLGRLATLFLVAWLGGGATALGQEALATFEQDELAIETEAGARHSFRIELAVTSRQQAQGLMYRRAMAADAGMLFIYPAERALAMWMKNTVIPLDMLFIAGDGRVVKLVDRTVPYSLTTISSDGPAKAVLELNGGTAARLGLKAGDLVLHSAFADGS